MKANFQLQHGVLSRNMRDDSTTSALRTPWFGWGLFAALIVSNSVGLTNEMSRDGQAVEIFRCDFADRDDRNFDQWPDGWTRQRGSGYPQYLEIGIEPRPGSKTDRCLSIQLDGGAALVSTPMIPVVPRFSYVLDAEVHLDGVERDTVTVLLTFLDQDEKPLETIESDRITKQSDWQTIHLGPIAPRELSARFAVVSLHVRPGEKEDLRGRVRLANVRFTRLPQMTLHMESPRPFVRAGETTQVKAEISGIVLTDSTLTFELFDHDWRSLAAHKLSMGAVTGAEKKSATNKEPSTNGPVVDQEATAWTSQSWKVPLPGPGFYYVSATLTGRDGSRLERWIRIAMLNTQPLPSQSEFCWTLPAIDRPLPREQMVDLLSQVGILAVKVPVWYGENEVERGENISQFADLLDQRGLEMVGMVDKPPLEMARKFSERQIPPAALVFTEKHLWMPSLDRLLSRLSLKVRTWQLGADDDASFSGDPALLGKLQALRKHFNNYGESIRLTIPWQSMYPSPTELSPSIDSLLLTANPNYTSRELLDASGAEQSSRLEKWLALQPLPRSVYGESTRTFDLVQRMVTAKIRGYQRVVVPQPFDDDTGLLRADGSPSELLLPWRTTALALAGHEYIGSLPLPQGSENHIFQSGSTAVMVLWNDRPCTETLSLAERLRVKSVWGVEKVLEPLNDAKAMEFSLEVGPLPQFVFGIDPHLARWCMDFDLENAHVQSMLGREQRVSFHYRNPFSRSMSGQFTIHAPDIAEPTALPIQLRASPEERKKGNFPIVLKAEVSSGDQPVRLDFEINTERVYHFSTYRNLHVGLEGIEAEFDTQLLEGGDLEVRIHFMNQTGRPISFQCSLFVPGRPRERLQAPQLGGDRQVFRFRLPRGGELIGRPLQLRIEEIGGSRVLNQTLIARE